MTLYHVDNGSKVGIYTPLILDKKSGWKDDMDTFIFNLNKNKKYKKSRKDCSLNCDKDLGMYTGFFGNYYSCKTMEKIIHYSNDINKDFENGSEILPSDGQDKIYNLLEVEVFQISFK